ncbi:MAG: FixH family protein [Chitinophagaceae bacterium]|nr:FixH family protein [Chitinophagaceae bacterium]
MNWFHKMMMVLVAFVSLMVYFAVRSVNTKLDLVTENYYEAELKHQDKMNQSANYQQLREKPEVFLEAKGLRVQFPKQGSFSPQGSVKLYFPADKTKDKEFQLALDQDHAQWIDIAGRSGAYQVQISWQQDGATYYTEKKIFL